MKVEKPFYSVNGLEGSWFHYGGTFQAALSANVWPMCFEGGHSICPGRFLARTAIIFTCALFVSDFDSELLTDSLGLDSWKFGLSVGRPKRALPFRIRRKA